jgi:hypothetical protein
MQPPLQSDAYACISRVLLLPALPALQSALHAWWSSAAAARQVDRDISFTLFNALNAQLHGCARGNAEPTADDIHCWTSSTASFGCTHWHHKKSQIIALTCCIAENQQTHSHDYHVASHASFRVAAARRFVQRSIDMFATLCSKESRLNSYIVRLAVSYDPS